MYSGATSDLGLRCGQAACIQAGANDRDQIEYEQMNDQVRIIGLSGTNGAGKDAIGILLSERCGYLFISVTELLRDEARRRGLPVERQHLRAISTEWRREFGLAVLVDRGMDVFSAAEKGRYTGIVMASLRNPYEADRVHELGGKVVWVDADPRVRYERVRANASNRDRAGEDDKTFEQFVAEEEAEMHSTGDAAALDMGAVKDRSDIIIMNNGSDMVALEQEVEARLGCKPQ